MRIWDHRFKPGAGLGLVLMLILAGCSQKPGPDIHLIAVDVSRIQTEANTFAQDSTSQHLVQVSNSLRELSDSYVAEDKPLPASFALEESGAAARNALAASTVYQRKIAADHCRRETAEIRGQWQDAVRMLEQTEKVADRTARGVPRSAALNLNRDPLPMMPSPPLDSLPDAAVIRAHSRDWKVVAGDLDVPISDLDARIIARLSQYQTKDAKPEAMEHHLRMAAWAVLEMAYRVQAEEENRVCGNAFSRALEFASYRDQALWAMVDLERGAKEGVRKLLEEERARTADRERELFESLKQFEGQFASIRREARGTIMSLSDILFDFGKSDLRRNAEINLAKIAVILIQYPEMKIAVEGHTDNIGSEAYNLKLSEQRAESVRTFMSEQGIDSERLSTLGYGMSQPVESNATEEGRQKNRRVDLVIREQ